MARIEILHPFASHSHVETNQSRQVHGKALVIVNENVKLKAFLYNLLPRTGHLRERLKKRVMYKAWLIVDSSYTPFPQHHAKDGSKQKSTPSATPKERLDKTENS